MSNPNQFFRYVDGVLKSFTSSSYLATFGETPTHPRDGEKLFGGRYENRTFYTGSVDSDTGLPNVHGALKNVGIDSGSYNIDFGG